MSTITVPSTPMHIPPEPMLAREYVIILDKDELEGSDALYFMYLASHDHLECDNGLPLDIRDPKRLQKSHENLLPSRHSVNNVGITGDLRQTFSSAGLQY